MVETKVYQCSGASLAQSPDLWAFVRDGLSTVKRRIGDRSDWQPLHISNLSISGNQTDSGSILRLAYLGYSLVFFITNIIIHLSIRRISQSNIHSDKHCQILEVLFLIK